jgi:hypothetical protein
MPLAFEPLSIDLQGAYRRRLAACSQVASDYSFINIWGWAESYGLQWAWDQDLVWIRQTLPTPVLWAPVGPWQAVAWKDALPAVCPPGTRLTRVPEALAENWKAALGKRVEAVDARGDWDYLYAAQSLIELAGNRYHKKKNLVNQFQRTYAFSYEPLGPATVAEALSLQTDWCTWRDCEAVDTLAAENRVIAKVLTHWEALEGICGGVLRIDGRLVAYTVAERQTADTLLIHFEKGNPEFKGVYQAINQAFVAHSAEGIRWVNREQDLGDEGLRRAKLSYHPEAFVPKCDVAIR